MLRSIFKDYEFNFVIDLSLGEGAPVMAALNLDKPIPVVGFVYCDYHAKLIDLSITSCLLFLGM